MEGDMGGVARALPRFETVGPKVAESISKRLLDVTLSFVALIALSPVFLAIAAAILIGSGWPVIFRQQRIGLNGEPFGCLKFRTMVQGADQMLTQLSSLNEAPFPAFKLRNDPRVTPFGRFLRRSSLDELPQLLNVLTGSMSLVGPRPPLVTEVVHYDPWSLGRLRARPGLTCYWQVDHRHNASITFREWVESDLRYIEQWSMQRDVGLLARTIVAVIKMSGD